MVPFWWYVSVHVARPFLEPEKYSWHPKTLLIIIFGKNLKLFYFFKKKYRNLNINILNTLVYKCDKVRQRSQYLQQICSRGPWALRWKRIAGSGLAGFCIAIIGLIILTDCTIAISLWQWHAMPRTPESKPNYMCTSRVQILIKTIKNQFEILTSSQWFNFMPSQFGWKYIHDGTFNFGTKSQPPWNLSFLQMLLLATELEEWASDSC